MKAKEDALKIVEQAKRDAKAQREKELSTIYPKLSAENQIQIIMLAKKLEEKEKTDRALARFWAAYNKLNDAGKELLLQYALELASALASDPRYRRA